MPCGGAVAALCLLLVLGLAGCGGGETVQEALGYEQTGPDEMAVIKRPPLIVPPDFNLRPPRPGAKRADLSSAGEEARRTLIGPAATGAAPAGEVAAVDSAAAGASEQARATLTGQLADGQPDRTSPPVPPNGAPEGAAAASASAGQTALLSRTNRVERDDEALAEARSENRVDGALLQRLLAFQPVAEAAAGKDGAKEAVVQVVRREQTPIVGPAE